MKTSIHFFDPAFEQLYTGRLFNCDIAWADNSAEIRQLFYQLNQPGKQQITQGKAYNFIQFHLKQVTQEFTTLITPDYSPNRLSSLQVATIPPVANRLCTEENVNRCVKQTAAVMLTQPCWLQNISPAISSQTLQSVQLISLYLQFTQKNQNGVDLQQSYQALLLASGIKIPNLHSHHFCHQTEHLTAIFDLATLQLSFSRFPRVLLPEIFGFTLAYCQSPTLIEICFPEYRSPNPFFQQHLHLLATNITPLRQHIAAYLALFPQHTQTLWRRIQQGFWLFQRQMQRSCQQLSHTLNVSLPPHQALSNILQQKAVAAIGHHKKIQLQGQPLDKWFAELPEKTDEFLHALLQSGYIDKQNPSNSRLLKLFDFNGPMFGVLNPAERDILLSWLQDELKATSASKKDTVDSLLKNTYTFTPHTYPVTPPKPKRYTQPLKIKDSFAITSNRELYYYLVNLDLYPEVLTTAKNKLRKLLHACAFFSPLPFKQYSHQQFSRYIENIYHREINAYTPLQGTPKISKEAYIWGFEQIAPMILIDGCWLQNSLVLQHIHPQICDILFSIYSDEIGCGQRAQNHPYIFQQLLDSLSIHTPPAYSRKFIEHPGFINSAFDLPVYMLTLSSFSVEFLPELLGLNMAIELSGLGNSYQRLVDDWNYWDINPSIANIHISIDNYASGHTFQAKQAIQLYMDGIIQNHSNTAILNKHWKRIYNGYASLRFVGGRFKLGLPVWYLWHKFRQ